MAAPTTVSMSARLTRKVGMPDPPADMLQMPGFKPRHWRKWCDRRRLWNHGQGEDAELSQCPSLPRTPDRSSLFCLLPDELMVSIITNLATYETRSSLVALSCTCKRFCGLVDPYLWSFISIVLYGTSEHDVYNRNAEVFCTLMRKQSDLQTQVTHARVIWRTTLVPSMPYLNRLTAKVVMALPNLIDLDLVDIGSTEIIRPSLIFERAEARHTLKNVRIWHHTDGDFVSPRSLLNELPRLTQVLIESPVSRLWTGTLDRLELYLAELYPASDIPQGKFMIGSASLRYKDFHTILKTCKGAFKSIQCGLPTENSLTLKEGHVMPELISAALSPVKFYLEDLEIRDSQMRHDWFIVNRSKSFELRGFKALRTLTVPIDIFAYAVDQSPPLCGVIRYSKYSVARALPTSLVDLTIYFDISENEIDHIAVGAIDPTYDFMLVNGRRVRNLHLPLRDGRDSWLRELASWKRERMSALSLVTIKDYLEQKLATYNVQAWQEGAELWALFRSAGVTLSLELEMFEVASLSPLQHVI